MCKDFTIFLWLLKLGTLVNLYLLADIHALPDGATDVRVLVPAQILLGVSAYRCLFPVGYKGNVVFHDSPLSSIFLTRLLATFSEVAYIYLFSHVIRLLNADGVAWVDLVSWLMVVQVVVSQGFVWGAILVSRPRLYFWEELGWLNIFAINTLASAYLCATLDDFGGRAILIHLNLLFGLVYLPWQMFHLRALQSDAWQRAEGAEPHRSVSGELLREGLWRSIRRRNPTSDARAWGGLIGLTWMASYWATLIPLWVHQIVWVLSR